MYQSDSKNWYVGSRLRSNIYVLSSENCVGIFTDDRWRGQFALGGIFSRHDGGILEGPPTATLHPFCLRYGIVSTRLICRTSAPPTGIKESGGGKSVCEMRAVFHRCYRLHGNTYVRQGRGKRGDAGATRGTCAAAGRTTFFLAEAINFHPARSRATAASSPSPSRFSFPPSLTHLAFLLLFPPLRPLLSNAVSSFNLLSFTPCRSRSRSSSITARKRAIIGRVNK